jgi:hypothetical protein
MSGEGGESKRELRRRMEETRDSISETVAEIKTVVTQQYEEVRERVETVREGVSEVLDWREQFERNPVVWGAGAVSVGILIGIGLSRAFDDDDDAPARGRRRREPNAGQRLMGELTGLADAVLPTISGHIKDLFGLDLDEYLRQTRRPKQLAEKPKRAARKSPTKKAATKKRAAKKGRNRARN